ncbi:unnamed protein product [Closterium sp. NIES-54]
MHLFNSFSPRKLGISPDERLLALFISLLAGSIGLILLFLLLIPSSPPSPLLSSPHSHHPSHFSLASSALRSTGLLPSRAVRFLLLLPPLLSVAALLFLLPWFLAAIRLFVVCPSAGFRMPGQAFGSSSTWQGSEVQPGLEASGSAVPDVKATGSAVHSAGGSASVESGGGPAAGSVSGPVAQCCAEWRVALAPWGVTKSEEVIVGSGVLWLACVGLLLLWLLVSAFVALYMHLPIAVGEGEVVGGRGGVMEGSEESSGSEGGEEEIVDVCDSVREWGEEGRFEQGQLEEGRLEGKTEGNIGGKGKEVGGSEREQGEEGHFEATVAGKGAMVQVEGGCRHGEGQQERQEGEEGRKSEESEKGKAEEGEREVEEEGEGQAEQEGEECEQGVVRPKEMKPQPQGEIKQYEQQAEAAAARVLAAEAATAPPALAVAAAVPAAPGTNQSVDTCKGVLSGSGEVGVASGVEAASGEPAVSGERAVPGDQATEGSEEEATLGSEDVLGVAGRRSLSRGLSRGYVAGSRPHQRLILGSEDEMLTWHAQWQLLQSSFRLASHNFDAAFFPSLLIVSAIASTLLAVAFAVAPLFEFTDFSTPVVLGVVTAIHLDFALLLLTISPLALLAVAFPVAPLFEFANFSTPVMLGVVTAIHLDFALLLTM